LTATYTYISSVDFINNLAFDYIETYSFQRGEAFEESRKKNREEFDELNSKKTENTLAAEEEKRFEYLLSLGKTQYLINEQGNFHWSAQKTNTFSAAHSIIDKLKAILLIEPQEVIMRLCAPMYRDAIVFYSKGHTIVKTLNVCLSCNYIETTMFNHINADEKVYDLLKDFFIGIGHKVEKQ
jgi:hypothetical protein